MHITAKSLYCESKCFFRNQLFNLIFIAILATSTTTIMVHFFAHFGKKQLTFSEHDNISKSSSLNNINSQSTEQKYKLIATFIFISIAVLTGNSILLGSILYLIAAVSEKKTTTLLAAIHKIIIILPKLTILVLILNLIIQIGFLILVFPGILLTALLSIAPIILVHDRVDIYTSIKHSICIVLKNINIIAPAITFWFLTKIILVMFFSPMTVFSKNIIPFLFLFCNNLVLAFLIIYFYRFYILLNHIE
ncbi:hypothetical protein CRV11_00755 [Candidatus Pantoea edessiphila]|uniref:UPF0259 membrane protein CRV11_00755 n=1 Tax=Candidatus Pantoea edessiphila TaxID=2044610 RepID=A0A2P5SYN6_9GAMM|nr:YciC family protein [Candidatus Pantoea edessiphila]MBK4775419.1 hypothetical protein [Pantoea sp. Edef]PPI87451.1 hypothetical protein CRV11_00755 [Candidatus Pantoea edessiphila]